MSKGKSTLLISIDIIDFNVSNVKGLKRDSLVEDNWIKCIEITS